MLDRFRFQPTRFRSTGAWRTRSLGWGVAMDPAEGCAISTALNAGDGEDVRADYEPGAFAPED